MKTGTNSFYRRKRPDMSNLKTIRKLIATLLVTLFMASAHAAESSQEKWNKLPESEKAHLRENFKRWKTMPESERQVLRNNFQRFEGLPSDQKAKVVQNYAHFKSLPHADQEKIRQRFQAFQRLSPQERASRIQHHQQRHQHRKLHFFHFGKR